MSAIVLYVTFSSVEEAKTVSQALLQDRLVACANILNGHSALYWWEGEIQSAEEVAVIYKTRDSLFEAVESKIKSLHSYDCPCIVSWDITKGHVPFMDWIEVETK